MENLNAKLNKLEREKLDTSEVKNHMPTDQQVEDNVKNIFTGMINPFKIETREKIDKVDEKVNRLRKEINPDQTRR